LSEYGVGAASATAAVNASAEDLAALAGTTLPGGDAGPAVDAGADGGMNPVVADSVIQSWLEGKLNGDDPAWPAADANTVYVLFFPEGYTVTLTSGFGMNAQTSVSCQSFGGYHSEITLDGQHQSQSVAYAVVPRCDTFGSLTGLHATTGATSHELAEAATDPFPFTNPAYSSVDDAHLVWVLFLGGGEIGDMCAQDPAAFGTEPPFPYTVQRLWSNSTALAGHDPCLPSISGVAYFNSAPVLSDMLSVGPDTFLGVHIPVGQTVTIPLDLFSDAPTATAWTVQADDLNALMGQDPDLSLVLEQASGGNGDKLQLSITALQASQIGVSGFLIVSSLGPETHFWVGAVGN
jgi:hypothetical protein